MPIDSGNLALKGLDDLFSTEENRQEEQREQVQQIPIDELHPFTNHPFKVLDDEAMTRTVTLRVDRKPIQDGYQAILIATGKTVEVEDREPFYTLLAIEFGAGIYYNSGNENPKANDFGLGVGTYPGQIHAFEDGWYYLGNDNQWHYTHGVKATMPMYNATMEIVNQYKQIAREVFS